MNWMTFWSSHSVMLIFGMSHQVAVLPSSVLCLNQTTVLTYPHTPKQLQNNASSCTYEYYRPNISKNQDRGLTAASTSAIWGPLLLPSPKRSDSIAWERCSHWMVAPCTPKSLFTASLVNSVKWKVLNGKEGWDRNLQSLFISSCFRYNSTVMRLWVYSRNAVYTSNETRPNAHTHTHHRYRTSMNMPSHLQ